MDRWCEQKLWKEWGLNTGGAELFASSTGLALCFIPAFWGAPKWTVLLMLLWASLIVLGVGTFIFHWIPNDEDDLASYFDWFPMALTCALLIFMFLEPNLKYMTTLYAVGALLLLLCYLLFLILPTDLLDPVFMNAVLVSPPVLVLALYTYWTLDARLVRVWALLLFSLTVWLINSYLCQSWTPLALLHSVFHIVMAVALWEAGCISASPP